MKPEQLNWSDEQWASHMSWDVCDIPSLRKWLNENYFPAIGQNKENGKFVFYLSKLDFAPSGATRLLPVATSNTEFKTQQHATKHANQVIIPSLEFNPHQARIMGVPQRVLQMLHINEKQK